MIKLAENAFFSDQSLDLFSQWAADGAPLDVDWEPDRDPYADEKSKWYSENKDTIAPPNPMTGGFGLNSIFMLLMLMMMMRRG